MALRGTSSVAVRTLTISATRTTATAPAGILFEATGTSSDGRVVLAHADIEYVWSFGDSGNFSRLDSDMPSIDKNSSKGHVVAHTFDTGGSTYTVTCTAHDGSGETVQATIEITILDPDTVFATTATAVVSGSSDYTGKPTGALEYTTIAAAVADHAGDTNQRILLRAGETFTGGCYFNETTGSGKKIHLGAFGTGADPIIDMSASGSTGVDLDGGASNIDEFAVYDIEILGEYDPTATTQTTAPSGNGINFATNDKALETHKTVHNVKMTNLGGKGIAFDGTDSTNYMRNLVVSNTFIEGWYDYGLQAGDAGYIAFVGSTIRQPTSTQNGNGKGSSPYWPDHGPFRLSRAHGPTVFDKCHIHSANSWFADSSGRSFQPCIRWNSGIADQKLNVNQCVTEGSVFLLHNNTGGSQIVDSYIVADGGIHINTDHNSATCDIPHGGTTVRNYTFVIPNTAPGTQTGAKVMVSGTGDGDTVASGAQTRRTEFYSNALIDLRSDANADNRAGTNGPKAFTPGDLDEFTTSYMAENIHSAPNRTSATNTHTPLNTTNGDLTVRYDGERWEGAAVDTTRAYGQEVMASFAPTTGSSAIGGATGKVSLLDANGNLRETVLAGLTRTAASIGPYEPNLES